MENKLIILPFDHRSSFLKDILNKPQKNKAKDMKKMIFEAFLSVAKNNKDFAILVDEELGSDILINAKELGVKICIPIEKSGQKELKLEFRNNFKEHIDKFNPDYVKVLVRYNPNNIDINKKQLNVLRKINQLNYKIILELLVPPTSKEASLPDYDKKARYINTIKAINEIKEVINVNIWKLEGFNKKQWEGIIKNINKESKIIFLGRGENKKKVVSWMKSASHFKEIIGFAIGRTIFLEPLKNYENNKISREEAIEIIKKNFIYFIDLWNKN
ncbi:MAG: DUF2090 domain-containing protein [Candidatus Pacebacteria bacterium]|nr:DUF2090 domain-containing protein [Candidatus Paceibacterota bacterium]